MDNVNQHAVGGSKTRMWALILAVIILVAGGAYYFLLQDDEMSNANTNTNPATNGATNDEVDTSDWRTYSNTKFGYSFMYPSDWQLVYDPSTLTPNPEADSIAFGGASGTFNVAVPSILADACDSLTSCVNQFPYTRLTDDTSSGLHDINIGGLNALTETIYSKQAEGRVYHVWYVYRNNTLIEMSTVSSASKDAASIPIYNAIVSTFSF